MGLYYLPCAICKKVFAWFSGTALQLCSDCVKDANLEKK